MIRAAVLILILLPLLASGLVLIASRSRTEPWRESIEQARLALMVAPTVLGIALLTVARLSPPVLALPEAFFENVAPAAGSVVVATPPPTAAVTLPWANFILGAYAAGLAWAVIRLLRAQYRLRWIADRSHPMPANPSIHITEVGNSPFIAYDGTIVVPRVLVDRLMPEQVALIVAHETAHLKRRDTLYFTMLAWVDALLWFNPFVRRQTHRCRWAAELAVDDAVVGRAPDRRQLYAATIVATLKLTARRPSVVTAPAMLFTPNKKDYRMRITRLLSPTASRRPRNASLLFAAIAILPAAIAQWSYADEAAVYADTFTVVPLDGKITSHFGHHRPKFAPKHHRGVDIAAPTGTAIVAPAAGRVVALRISDEGYGNLLTLDHGGGVITRYAHVDTFEVQIGEVVDAGATIARVGNTGLSTGPHLHLELLVDGEHIDPATRIPLPHKTPRTL